MDSLQWFDHNESFHANHIQKLRDAARKYMKKLAHRDNQDPILLGDNKIVSNSHLSTSAPQNIDFALYNQIAENSAIAQATIHSILQKAEELISSSNATTTAPVEGVARMVKSTSHPSRPHLAQVYQNGKTVRCSHCVAVAHCLDRAKDFITWFTSHSKKLNFTKLSTSIMLHKV